jgi:hypothetical protein
MAHERGPKRPADSSPRSGRLAAPLSARIAGGQAFCSDLRRASPWLCPATVEPSRHREPGWVVARPTGVGRAITTYRIPIEGRDEWLEAAKAAERPA